MAETKCKRGFQSHVMCDCEPVHPLTPREKVADRGPAGAIMDALWPILGGDQMDAETWTEISKDVGAALASGSGDHAELAGRLRRTFASFEHDNHGGYGRCGGSGRVWVDDGKASNFYDGGTCDRCADNTPAPINPDGPAAADALEALLAENAALRVKVRTEIKLSVDNYVRATARATEAERKLAEAVGLLAWARDELPEINPSNYDHEDACHLNAKGVEVALAITSWLSKEAERG